MIIKESVKIIISSSCILLLLVHFSSLFIYSKPIVANKTKIDFYAQGYVYPYFHQNWNLFVPVPDSNYKLYCEFDDEGTQTIDVFSEINIQHQTNRLKGYEPLLVAFSNSIHYFEKNTALREQLNGPVENELSFKMLERVVKNYLEYSRKIKIQKIKIMLVSQNTQTRQQKIYFK
ncbi:MAG: hypothetical protein Q7W45_11105 [Bacteroidota bacterium]|nr:hypothetical protein [Bacteroidota bacterium]MDP3147128.1 hypothetical protein [Bacteroidota bacterium]